MFPLLILVGLAATMAGEPPVAAEDASAPKRWRAGDLEIEGTLTRLGVAPDQATQISAEWLPPIAAPERARREERDAGWEYDVARVWVSTRRLDSGRDIARSEAAGTWRRPDPCAPLELEGGGPTRLKVVAPPTRRLPSAIDVNERRRSMTLARTEEERLALVGLEAGESATLVELVPDEGTPPRRRARTRRQLSVEGRDARLALRDGTEGPSLCVHLEPPPETVEVDLGGRSLEQEVRAIRERLEQDSPAKAPSDPEEGSDATTEWSLGAAAGRGRR